MYVVCMYVCMYVCREPISCIRGVCISNQIFVEFCHFRTNLFPNETLFSLELDFLEL